MFKDPGSVAKALGEDAAACFDWRRGFRVSLGNDVWIGHGAVVSHDVPPFAIAVGVPAKLLRFRFPPEIVVASERTAWWNWSRERLAAGLADFRSLGAEAFCRKYDPA
jgi:hypothetical protein